MEQRSIMKKKRILILEDSPERQKQFKILEHKHVVVITESTKECIHLLTTCKWDILFLDHDLGGQVHVPSGEETGYEVAKFLSENQRLIPKLVILHSLNAGGRKLMKGLLQNSIEFPFVWTEKALKSLNYFNI